MLLNSALISLFLSTPSARRATGAAQCEEVSGCISIHALREEGDGRAVLSPYSPAKFLSTPSARRATCAACASICRRGNFYPRPPRGGRPD